MPDLVLKNGFTAFKPLGGDFYYLPIDSNGWLTWTPFMVFESKCHIDVSYFPFDKQTCNIIFETWSYSRNEIYLQLPIDAKVEFHDFIQNSIWVVTSTDAVFDSKSISNDITFVIHLKRKPLYYIFNIILPIMCLGILNVFVFIVPADAGEKMGYTVSIFLSLAVFLTLINAELPVNSDSVSIMSLYLMLQLGLSVVVIFITSLQLRLHHRMPEREIRGLCRLLVRGERRIRRVDKRSSSICRRRHVRTVQVAAEGKPTTSLDNDVTSKTEKIMEWADVSSAIDFFSFWIFASAELIISIIMFSFSVL
jgi:hypothetical protein